MTVAAIRTSRRRAPQRGAVGRPFGEYFGAYPTLNPETEAVIAAAAERAKEKVPPRPREPWYVKRLREDIAQEETERLAEQRERERRAALTPEQQAEEDAAAFEELALDDDEWDEGPLFTVGPRGLTYVGARASNNPRR